MCLPHTDNAGRQEELPQPIKPSPTKFSFGVDDPQLCDCFLNFPDLDDDPFPLDYNYLQIEQQEDHELQYKRAHEPQYYPIIHFSLELQLICYKPQHDHP